MLELATEIFNYLLHIDVHLGAIIADYGFLSYAILFAIVFLETGFVVIPFLPGDSLLFAAGALSAVGSFHPLILFFLLLAAAIFGDTVNYWAGYRIGEKIFQKDRPFISEEYLLRTKDFYQKHGQKTIILARFIPIIRTFAPFIAGVVRMKYQDFLSYNVIGGFLWIATFVFGGYLFGNIPIVKENFGAVIIGIIVLSFIPAVIEFWKHRKKR